MSGLVILKVTLLSKAFATTAIEVSMMLVFVPTKFNTIRKGGATALMVASDYRVFVPVETMVTLLMSGKSGLMAIAFIAIKTGMGGGVRVSILSRGLVDLEFMCSQCVQAGKGFRAKLTGMGGGVMSL